MSETKRIVNQLNLAFSGSAWHGPSVMEVLKGVTAARAAARPIPNAHTIWELAYHIGTWKEVVRCRIVGETVHVTDEENFPTIAQPTAAAWKRTLALLKKRHDALVKAVAALPDARLDTKPGRKASTLYVQIHGAIQHDLYHAGQIMLLNKAIKAGKGRPA